MITGCPSLEIFDLSENDIGDDGINLCVHHINNLTELKLELCGLSVKGTYICIIKYSIFIVAIIGCITSYICNTILLQLQLCILILINMHESCCFSRCIISTTGAGCIKTILMEANKLYLLRIGKNNIGDDGISYIAEGLQKNESLTILKAFDCGFKEKGSLYVQLGFGSIPVLVVE